MNEYNVMRSQALEVQCRRRLVWARAVRMAMCPLAVQGQEQLPEDFQMKSVAGVRVEPDLRVSASFRRLCW